MLGGNGDGVSKLEHGACMSEVAGLREAQSIFGIDEW
jgi:hypothetical protein